MAIDAGTNIPDFLQRSGRSVPAGPMVGQQPPGPGLLGAPGQQAPAPPGAPTPAPKWHDVTIRKKKRIERVVCAPVPPEEFGITRFGRNIHDTGYCFHEVIKRESDMIEQGYEPEQIRNINTYAAFVNQEEMARDTVEERMGATGDFGFNRANRQIKITEHYIKLDYEGNGRPAMYRITTGGEPSEILRRAAPDSPGAYTEEIIRLDGPPPFAAITPIPMPHRFFGRSIADMVMDIQRIKTVILRGMLDNAYTRINPRAVVHENLAGPSTVEDMLTNRPDAVIRARQPGAIEWQEAPDIGPSMLPLLQYEDAQREWRSGVSRQGQGTDGNALQNQVATIANQMQDAAAAKIKLIGRIFAETGIRDLFLLIHQTLRKHGTQPQTVRLRGKWVEVDPRSWKERERMTINVGLGPSDKARQLQAIQILIGAQEKAIQAGLVSKRNLYNSAKELTRAVRPGADVETFFIDPGIPPNPQDPASAPLPPPQNPKQLDAQVKLQAEQMRMQLEGAKAQHDVSLKQAEAAIKDKQAQAQIIVGQQKAQSEMAIAQQKFELEKEIKLIEAGLMRERHAVEIEHLRQKHQADLMHSAQSAAIKVEAAKAQQETKETKTNGGG
jgi:hypothetical protein